VVIPVLDEEGSVERLAEWTAAALSDHDLPFEVIFVDDGSTDSTPLLLDRVCDEDPRMSVIHLRRNFGKAAALTEGFGLARGSVVVTMDGDLQDDPLEIPRLTAELDRGFDVVSGWKRDRHDPWHKTVPSRFFNRVTSITSGLYLKDHNSGLKAYRREVLDNLDLVGEMHRFITVMAHWQGYRVTEIPVNHHPRQHGRSKYGAGRLIKGAFDLLTALLTTRYNLRPLHLFGFAGLVFAGLGIGVLTYLTVLWFMGLGPIGTRPLLFLGLLLTMVGVQFVSTGLLAELIVRQPHPGQHRVASRRPDPGL
jgi:glycosyltransferase involved in cell wall biosynthesis